MQSQNGNQVGARSQIFSGSIAQALISANDIVIFSVHA